jgi:hypothetical protein
MKVDQLTVAAFNALWEKDFLPSIKKEIRAEIKAEINIIPLAIRKS